MAQIDPFWRDTHGLARPSTADQNGGYLKSICQNCW